MKFIIEGEFTDLNTYIQAERRNKFIAAKIKKDETTRVAWDAKSQHLKKITKPIPEVLIDWYVKDTRKDADNIVFAKKFILDGLVVAGILPDDNRRYITAFNEAVFVDKARPRVEIQL